MPNWWGRVHLFIYFVKKCFLIKLFPAQANKICSTTSKKSPVLPPPMWCWRWLLSNQWWEDETRNKRGLCDGISVTRHTLCEWVRSLTGEIELPLGQIHKPPPWRCNPVPLWSPPSTLCPPDSLVDQEIQSWVENKLPIITANENWLEATVKRMQQTSKSKWSEMASQSKQ